MITNYTELKAAIPVWMYRDDMLPDVQAAEFIQLAEGRLNRELDTVSTDSTLTGVVGSRRIDISSLSLETPVALHIKENGVETQIGLSGEGTFPYTDTNGKPSIWGIEGDNIDFNCPCDQAYSFRLTYYQRFALSDGAPTNWLLTNHPDIYFAAAMVWGKARTRDIQSVVYWRDLLTAELPKLKKLIARSKIGPVRLDPMLTAGNNLYPAVS